MSKKNKPCITEDEMRKVLKETAMTITEDEIRKVLKETVMTCSSINKSEWNFCVETPGVFYWENRYNKTRIGVHLNQNDDVYEIYSLNLSYVVYIRIYINNRCISWEGNSINSILQPYMHDAFVKLSELIKDESEESKVVDTSERKLISAKELCDFLKNNIVREFMHGELADAPYAPPSVTYEWYKNDSTYHFGYRGSEDIGPRHWEIFTSVNENNDDNVNIKIYKDHIVLLRESSDFNAVSFGRMFKLFNDLAKEFDLEKFYDTEMIDSESEVPQEVVDTSERKLISAKELEDFLMKNIVREFIEGEFVDTPYAPPSITYEWRVYSGDIYHFGYRYEKDIPHWEIFTSKNDKSDENVNIKIYNDHIVFMKASKFQAVHYSRMLKLFNDLAKEFNLEKFDDTGNHFESEVPQEVVKTETNESKITEGEKEMENKDNYIKMDGEKDSFEGGAIRYTKKGKGRYDLIPSQQIHDILEYGRTNWDNIIGKDDKFCSIYNVLMSAYPDTDDLSYVNYIEIIINIIRYCYITASNNQNFYAFVMGFVEMLKDLAIHYEMGAEKYGVDNWKNGIPETKGERGGSFRDSGLRHLQQLLDGQTDEPHQIAAIWNFIGAMYRIRNLIDRISGKKHRDTCENCDDPKNSDSSEIYNDIKALLGTVCEDDDQDINHLIEDMMSDIVIDLSHPDPDMNFQCFLMGNIHTNNFCVAFNPNDKKDWHIFNKNKVSITVFREYCNNLECDRFEITGIDIHGVQCKLNIDRSSITNLDSEFNVKVELSTALEVKQAPQEVVLYKFDFRSTPKKIPKDLWDRFYYNFLSNAVEVRPV